MISGEKFGELTAVKFMYKIGDKKYWLFRCSCGKEIVEYVRKIINGTKTSCGCKKTRARMTVKGNEIEIKGKYSIIYITHLKTPMKCLIDTEDLERVKKYTWCIQKDNFGKIYAVSKTTGKLIWMHRLIMNCPKDKIIDHINISHTLDNRKCNLRICTHRENMQNFSRSEFNQTGVHFDKKKNKYNATIFINGKLKWLGTFDNYELAVEARKKAEHEFKFFNE